ncbi:g-protein coupled receptor moody [Lasius niger]|uniref:G-protein coupled receptor moody n=1 Tax=Lasius niger TaxID=67767 RepID=A0A0J7KG95_LASNI|nr:g-protein coupled receptor moody [Lasius niger]
MSQAFKVGRGQMESLNQNLDTFGMSGIMDGTATWLPRIMDNATQSTTVDAELSRYVDPFKAYFWNVPITMSIELSTSDASLRPLLPQNRQGRQDWSATPYDA